MPFPARAAYETLLYNLREQYADHIAASTVHLFSTSALTARVTGSIQFASGLELRVAEFIDFVGGRIRDYSYTVYLGAEKARWYDPQPHPDNAALAPTFPHHYHTPPDIKHNRQPAPGMSFDAPNLPTLIHACIELGRTLTPK